MLTRKTARNSLARNAKGVSTIISTIIITGTLLIILVIASFVSANVLDMQIANTEFEQAKTNMLTLDETIQDVALRRGSGGYVQFNQRSGGIGINITTQKLSVLGPSEQTTALKSPTATNPPTGGWMNPAGAYVDGWSAPSDYASIVSDKPSVNQTYSNYGFNIPSGSNIQNVRVRYDAWTSDNELIMVGVSWNGGTQWSSFRSTTLTLSEVIYWYDVTSVTAWNSTKLNDANFRVRVFAYTNNPAQGWVMLDWIPVEVTYIPSMGTIYESSNLVGILYRGGSKVSGTSLDLRGTNSLVIDMSDSLGYVRVATDNGLKIKLDYYRVKIATNSTMMIGNAFYNFTQITFINLINGTMGGTDVINFKVQNTDVNTYTKQYDSYDVTIYVQLGNGDPVPIRLYSSNSDMHTAIIFTEIKILVSTS